MPIELWTDGSGTTAATPGGWGFVLRHIHPTTAEVTDLEGSGAAESGTNNQMELTAVLMGLRALKRPGCKVTVFTDSEYVGNAFRQNWIDGWNRKGWRKVKNATLWQELIVEVWKHDVTFDWVPGHSGVILNERCDELAGNARRELVDKLANTSDQGERIAS